jgi:hypothetical protein
MGSSYSFFADILCTELAILTESDWTVTVTSISSKYTGSQAGSLSLSLVSPRATATGSEPLQLQ